MEEKEFEVCPFRVSSVGRRVELSGVHGGRGGAGTGAVWELVPQASARPV